jgi:hypothetical protein
LYIDYLKKELDAQLDVMSEKQQQYYQVFKENLEKGLNYYTGLLSSLKLSSKKALDNTLEQIEDLKNKLQAIQVRGLNIV